jgi:prepilin-type N-terminal cleavage/methylation domain-containing protein
MSLFSKKNKSGFTLIELLLVLGVLALLLLAMFVVYPQVRRQNVANEQLVGMRTMVEGVRSVYGRHSYDGVSGTVARASGMVPDILKHPTNPNGLMNHWGRAVGLSSWGEDDFSLVSTSYRSRMRVTYPGFPQEYCVLLATGFMGFADKVYVAPMGGPSMFSPENQLTEMDPTRAVELCSRPATSNLYSLGLFFR